MGGVEGREREWWKVVMNEYNGMAVAVVVKVVVMNWYMEWLAGKLGNVC